MSCCSSQSTRLIGSDDPIKHRDRVVLANAESLKPLYLFVFKHFQTQNRFPLLLEMLEHAG
ncbi:hypothetical protein DEA98_00355 [Brucella pseudogrignonensis]|nr:hypothetical protein [Brucella pseudogrignonensis]